MVKRRHQRIEVYQSYRTFNPAKRLWYWRFRASNGRIIADGGEGYASRANVLRAAKRFRELFSETVEIKERYP